MKKKLILELIFMIENFIFKLGCLNGENALKWEVLGVF